VIRWAHRQDPTTEILLTENGWCGNETIENYDQLWYYHSYMGEVLNAIEEGIPIIGYTAWSLLDNYEWGSFEPRFGLFYVDYPDQGVGSPYGYLPEPQDLQRIPRPAAHLIAYVAQTGCLPGDANSTVISVKLEKKSESPWYFRYIVFALLCTMFYIFYKIATTQWHSHGYHRI